MTEINKDELQGHNRDAEEALAGQQPETSAEVPEPEHETKAASKK